MATANPLVCTPNPVPAGTVGEIDLTFVLVPGTPDVVANLTLTRDGQMVNSGSVVLRGTSGETLPNVTPGSTGAGWELQASAGTLAALGANKFTIRY